MSKPANKTLIGTFVIGGLALAIASVVILGSGKFFSHRNKYEVYFRGSVKGLEVGSPVMFRGVKLGEVTDITLYMDVKDLTAIMPVTIDIDPEKFMTFGGPSGPEYSHLEALIAKGLRAQLQMSSIVTGQQMVYLDFFPDTPIEMLAPSKAQYPEIPTVPSSAEELVRRLEELPLKDIADKLESSLDGISRLVNSPQLTQGITSANKLLAKVDQLVSQNANLSNQTSQTLNDVSRLTRSLNSFADYLSRHPESLIRGKSPAKGD